MESRKMDRISQVCIFDITVLPFPPTLCVYIYVELKSAVPL